MTTKKTSILVATLSIIIVLGVFGYGGYRYKLLRDQNISLGSKVSDLEGQLSTAESKNDDLANKLGVQEQINNSFTNQISGISSTVDNLQKLAATDPELLKKYSKVYFLNENYIPASLANIDQAFVYDKSKPEQFLSPILPHLNGLLAAGASANLHLEVISAYRSFNTQESLKSAYKVTYGKGTANQFSADQGYSEHQLGTAVDFTTPSVADTFSTTAFQKSPEYTWLLANAWQYGFIESYPEGNSFYVFEPWHWRYVGVALATKLHQTNEHFYDMDQRDIDSYLIDFYN